MTNKEDCYQQALQHIIDIGLDYDGCKSVESLKELIDELVHFAKNGLNEKRPQYVNRDQVFELVFGKWIVVPEDQYCDTIKKWFEVQEEIKQKKLKDYVAPTDW